MEITLNEDALARLIKSGVHLLFIHQFADVDFIVVI